MLCNYPQDNFFVYSNNKKNKNIKNKFTSKVLRIEAALGEILVLKYAHENGCDWDVSITCSAAENGQLECLKYLHENGCPWNEYTTPAAAENGHLDCLKYAHENGCPWDEYTTRAAAENGHLDCLKYAYENGCPLYDIAIEYAAQNGHVECVQYAIENDLVFDLEDVIIELCHFLRDYDKLTILLDDSWWRNYLFNLDFTPYIPSLYITLEKQINKKKAQIEQDKENSNILYEELNVVPKDVVKYVIQSYF
jgi:hypothetical protein